MAVKIISTDASIRVSFVATTDAGELHSCVFVPVSVIKPDPANLATVTQLALSAIQDQSTTYETNQLAAIQAIKDAPPITDDQKLQDALSAFDGLNLDSIADPTLQADIEAFKAALQAKIDAAQAKADTPGDAMAEAASEEVVK